MQTKYKKLEDAAAEGYAGLEGFHYVGQGIWIFDNVTTIC
jgi:hypothetical protein